MLLCGYSNTSWCKNTTITFENGIAQERIDLTGVEEVQAFVLDNETAAPDCGSKEYTLN